MLIEVGGTGSVKRLLILALLVLGGFAVWRKVQAQRADLDLWSEATTPDDY
jgi:MYXO-CTERM domain-containing protein